MCLLGFVLAGTDVAPVEVGYWQGYADAYGVAVEFGGRGFLVAHAGTVAHAEGEVDVGDALTSHLRQLALGGKGQVALLHDVETQAVGGFQHVAEVVVPHGGVEVADDALCG